MVGDAYDALVEHVVETTLAPRVRGSHLAPYLIGGSHQIRLVELKPHHDASVRLPLYEKSKI